MTGTADQAVGKPTVLFARWWRLGGDSSTSEAAVAAEWRVTKAVYREFWRELDAAQGAKQDDTGPRAVTMEIVERNHKTTDSLAGSVIIPNEVRINGMPIIGPADVPVRVHDMSFGADREAAVVTITMFVRKLTVAAEGDLRETPAPDA